MVDHWVRWLGQLVRYLGWQFASGLPPTRAMSSMESACLQSALEFVPGWNSTFRPLLLLHVLSQLRVLSQPTMIVGALGQTDHVPLLAENLRVRDA